VDANSNLQQGLGLGEGLLEVLHDTAKTGLVDRLFSVVVVYEDQIGVTSFLA